MFETAEFISDVKLKLKVFPVMMMFWGVFNIS